MKTKPLPPRQAAKSPRRLLSASSPRLSPVPLPEPFRRQLAGLMRRHLLFTMGMEFAWMGAALGLLWLAQGLLDWSLDLSRGVRAIFLLLDLAALGGMLWRRVVPAYRRRLDLEGAALLVQKTWPQVQGAFIAGVQLAGGRGTAGSSPKLIAALLERVALEAARLDFRRAFSIRPCLRVLLVALALWTGLGAILWLAPATGRALLGRLVLIPMPLPTRTVVTPISRDLTIAIGADAVLEARATGVIPTHGRVAVTYGLREVQELAPLPQADRSGVFSLTLHNVQRPFSYRFFLNDGQGESYTVRTLIAPAVASLACRQIYPAYTHLPPQERAPSDLSLLEGSTLHLHLQANLPLSHAAIVYQGIPGGLEMSLGLTDNHQAEADIPIPTGGLTGFSIHLQSQEGQASLNDTVYPVTVAADAPPVIQILEPKKEDVSVTLHAAPQISFQVSDDFGLTKVEICYEIGAPAAPGQELPQAQAQKPIPFDLSKLKLAPGVPATLTYTWNIAAQTPAWQEGDLVTYWIEAVDNNNATGPGVSDSNKQHFEIVSPEVKQAQTLQELDQVEISIGKLLQDQRQASKQVEQDIDKKPAASGTPATP